MQRIAHVQMNDAIKTQTKFIVLMATTCVLVCSVPVIVAVISQPHSMFSHWPPAQVWAPPKCDTESGLPLGLNSGGICLRTIPHLCPSDGLFSLLFLLLLSHPLRCLLSQAAL